MSKFGAIILNMKAKIVLLLVLAIIVNSCNKSGFGTNPSLTFVNANQTKFNTGDNVVFNLSFKQQTGSLDTLFIKRHSLVCSDTDFVTTLNYPVPAFTETKDQTGQIIVSFAYGTSGNGDKTTIAISNGSCYAKRDTSIFKFCLKDNAGHLSDTVQSPKLVFVNN